MDITKKRVYLVICITSLLAVFIVSLYQSQGYISTYSYLFTLTSNILLFIFGNKGLKEVVADSTLKSFFKVCRFFGLISIITWVILLVILVIFGSKDNNVFKDLYSLFVDGLKLKGWGNG